jgi:hypothetical protein
MALLYFPSAHLIISGFFIAGLRHSNILAIAEWKSFWWKVQHPDEFLSP